MSDASARKPAGSEASRASADSRAWEGWQPPEGLPDSRALAVLTADAAARAGAILAGQPELTTDPLIDAVRLLASASGALAPAAAAELTGHTEAELRRLVLAHRHGGTGGVSAALAAIPVGDPELATAQREVSRSRAFSDRELVVEPGAITDVGAGLQVRHGPDGRWYPFTLTREQWWPAVGANVSAGIAYQAAARARSLRRANT